jgi:hypothetical protein
MRNRGCEVFLPPAVAAAAVAGAHHHADLSVAPHCVSSTHGSTSMDLDEADAKAILAGLGLESHETQSRLVGLHRDLVGKIPCEFSIFHLFPSLSVSPSFPLPCKLLLPQSVHQFIHTFLICAAKRVVLFSSGTL